MPTLTFLGTGASYAVPSPGCDCSVCRRGFKPFAKWYRTRCSALIQNKGKHLLIDVSPDFREQMLKQRVPRLEACLITHAHADAVMGLPDIRSYSKQKKIPLFASARVLKSIRKRFDYAFNAKIKTTRPDLELKKFLPTMKLFGLRIQPIRVNHPPVLTHGYRINDLAYLSDIKSLPKESKKKLKGIKTLVLGATGDEHYIGHQNISDAIRLAKELKAKRVFFTHIGHRIERMKIKLPKGMQLAHDGLKIKF
jgi:phosphoribosyl 1,2-cyclic phosphate phosphodiesterase